MTERSSDGARLTGAAGDPEQPARAVAAEIAPTVTGESSRRSLPSGVMRNLGLVIALVFLCIVGLITPGDRFASTDNVLTILRLASVIGVVSIGMTFVITGVESTTRWAPSWGWRRCGRPFRERNCSPTTCTGRSWSVPHSWSARRLG